MTARAEPLPPTRALSRTCALADFPGCRSVAAWQQTLADLSWEVWQTDAHLRTRAPGLCVNYADVPFVAPGPGACYRDRRDDPNGNGLAAPVPAIWALAVLDHIDAPVRFLLRADELLRPGGLLFLTFSFWNANGADCASGHEDRARIYDAEALHKLVREARRLGFRPFGGSDWTYRGHTLGNDHSLASLVLTRRGGDDAQPALDLDPAGAV